MYLLGSRSSATPAQRPDFLNRTLVRIYSLVNIYAFMCIKIHKSLESILLDSKKNFKKLLTLLKLNDIIVL